MKKSNIDKLLDIMLALRNPDSGCPWDVEQTFQSISPYTIEEAYEVADAIERSDIEGLKDELGDLLFQVIFHSEIAKEEGHFVFNDVVVGIIDKMVRRHPHVFSEASVRSSEAQSVAWEDIKARERLNTSNSRKSSAMSDVPLAFPALMRAQKLQKRAARIGFDWPTTEGILEKIDEEILEVKDELLNTSNHERVEEEIGDLLFVCVNLARKLNVDAEIALKRASKKFERRFRAMESILMENENLKKPTLEDMERIWTEVKKLEKT
ncbi:MAG: nucleoside triphosphate pyrophosphohydrolase [Magnetovibrio sp.]|nr:nucleoside triphosphate pyrophosphohydrolase [Magnetovibrio sp.]|tara:strand:+ start:1031 stop:1828 length:798 start_codon:yes stop_codon:yes gene_type:complete